MLELSQRRKIVTPFGIVLYIICMTIDQLLQKGDLVVGLCDQFRYCHALSLDLSQKAR
jgi:hypothetical protein